MILIQAENKPQMFERLRNFHETLRNSKLKAAPDKTFLFLIAVKLLGHAITRNKIEPLLITIEAIQQKKRPEKKDVMKLLGALNYYSKYFLIMLFYLHYITYSQWYSLSLEWRSWKCFYESKTNIMISSHRIT